MTSKKEWGLIAGIASTLGVRAMRVNAQTCDPAVARAASRVHTMLLRYEKDAIEKAGDKGELHRNQGVEAVDIALHPRRS